MYTKVPPAPVMCTEYSDEYSHCIHTFSNPVHILSKQMLPCPPQVDPGVGAVVVGWDPLFDYSRLVYASVCLR